MAQYENKLAALNSSRVWSEAERVAQAREYVQNGITWLNANVSGWRERVMDAPIIDMITSDYCMLATACKGQCWGNRICYTAGDVARALPQEDVGNPKLGFYANSSFRESNRSRPEPPVTYENLQAAWMEALGRKTCL